MNKKTRISVFFFVVVAAYFQAKYEHLPNSRIEKIIADTEKTIFSKLGKENLATNSFKEDLPRIHRLIHGHAKL
ncbi:MAG: hypothetical protein HOE90_04085 [Bacteriovoracaceae bacterium]|mgnify:CR=1|jgi:hypothetical protein|nr:hypothetical protein [Bacteriovoracaceae bacterium]